MILSHLPALHTGSYPTGALHSDWSPEPTVVLGTIGLAAAYVLWTGPLNRRRPDSESRPVSTAQQALFLAGCLALLLALSPPLDDWADNFLLTAHMFQHVVLIFVVAPLF
jgi:cytochrome c oxidase assembly factor CtaG